MPRLIEPPGMPEEVSTAIETIGNRARIEILRSLTLHGPLTLTELADDLGVGRSTTQRHLAALERQNLVAGDVPLEDRWHRAQVRWQVNTSTVDEAFAALRDYAAGR
ncbi:ArsR/SmtB family transcription factor [Isoptericola rhizosphaerae]|uniref:ArsR/SmtB family transcription factor n=1 Tax=Isoptericola rhizosphaerae TaxID=3377837 RepID=UPI00383A6F33